MRAFHAERKENEDLARLLLRSHVFISIAAVFNSLIHGISYIKNTGDL